MPSTLSRKCIQWPFIRPDMFPKLINPLTEMLIIFLFSHSGMDLVINITSYLNKSMWVVRKV